MCIYICIQTIIYIYIYIHTHTLIYLSISLHLSLSLCTYIYIYRERERSVVHGVDILDPEVRQIDPSKTTPVDVACST